MNKQVIGQLVASALVIAANGAFAHQADEVGAVSAGHVGTSSNMPVTTAYGDCVNIGSAVGTTGHPADCTIQPPPPPPPAPVVPPPAPAPVTPPPPPPAPPVEAPAPAPVVVPAPAPKMVELKKITLAADALFDFDKSNLRPAGKQRIDEELAKTAKLGGPIKVEHITVTGHTDIIGTDKYNDKLSVRRAESVKAYIVSKGYADSEVATAGKGKHEPVATNKTAAGRQLNRRVEISFEGTEELK